MTDTDDPDETLASDHPTSDAADTGATVPEIELRVTDELIGAVIGPYEIIEAIGAGGMGQVYKARQTAPVKRDVALKVIKAGLDSGQVIARFEAERQALALMDHPHIAKVLDAGTTPAGYPFFVMELVDGQTIHEFCDGQCYDLRERLQLFVQICQAVQHAHQKGIIHRDLKPSNVLVSLIDGQPQVKVIDFGLAKATEQSLTDETMCTMLGQIVGTPAYMSPEQADAGRIDIDTRTDVYSLGVLLYELLSGVPPLDLTTLRRAAYAEIQRIIREQEPPRMSARLSSLGASSDSTAQRRSTNSRNLVQSLRGDLDVIVMKALEKDRDRRYETPISFAEDVQRYLKHEVIRARPASTAYRIRRFTQRNRLAVAGGGLLFLSLASGIAVSTRQAQRARTAEALAEARLEQVRAQQSITEQALADTRIERDRAQRAESEAAAEAATTTAINEFLKYDLLGEAAPSKNPRNQQVTVEEVVKRAAASIQDKFKDEPLVAADLCMTIGETLAALGELPDSQQQFEIALELRLAELGEEHEDTIMAINNVGLLLKWQGDYDQAEEYYQRALRLYRRVNGNLHAYTLGTIHNLAMLYMAQNKLELAEPLFVESLAGSRATQGDDHPDTLETMNNLAGLYRSLGDLDKAEPLLRESLEIRQRVLGEEHPDTLSSLGNLALWLQDKGRYEEAEEHLRQALEISSRVSGEEHFVTLIFMNNLGNLFKQRKMYAAAEPLLKQAWETRLRVLGETHDHTLGTLLTLANLYREQNDFAKAQPLYQQRVEILERKFGPESREVCDALTSYGEDLLTQQQCAVAVEALRRSREIRNALAAEGDLKLAHILSLLGAALAEQVAADTERASSLGLPAYAEAERLMLSGYATLADSDFGHTPDGLLEVEAAAARLVRLHQVQSSLGDESTARRLSEASEAAR